MPAIRSLAAMPMPDIPAPMMATRGVRPMVGAILRLPQLRGPALRRLAVGALQVAPAAGERLGDGGRYLVLAERPVEPRGGPHVVDAHRARRWRVVVAPRPGDAAEVVRAVG